MMERTEVGKSVTAGNLQAIKGDTFSVDPKSGFLIVFYNSDATDGQFTFEYWVEATEKSEAPVEKKEPEPVKVV